jgi:hypothetical protein
VEDIDRRVYRPELQKLLGVGPTWLRTLEKAGKIPSGRQDVGAKRKWWLASEVRAIVAGQHVRAPEKQPA